MQRTEFPLAPSEPDRRYRTGCSGRAIYTFFLHLRVLLIVRCNHRTQLQRDEGRPRFKAGGAILLLYDVAFLRNNPELPAAFTTLPTIACVIYRCGKEGQPVSR